MRFNIRNLMLAVAVVAVLLAIQIGLLAYHVHLWALAIPCLFPALGWRLWRRGRRRIAAIGFIVLSASINLAYMVACLYFDYMINRTLWLTGLVIFVPAIASVGAAWAGLACREGVTPRMLPSPWTIVTLSATTPFLTLATLWPLHLAFFVIRPSLERLADRVEAGHALVPPALIGPFHLEGSGVDRNGTVGLYTDSNPNGRSGFVRVHPEATGSRRFDPLIGTDTSLYLGHGWSYRQDD